MDATVKSGGAAVMSFIIPGLGQMYRGQFMEAAFWFLFAMVAWLVFWPVGLIMNFVCAMKAYDPKKSLDKKLW